MLDSLSKRTRDSITFTIGIVGFIATLFSILGYSFNDFGKSINIWVRFVIVLGISTVLCGFIYLFIGIIYSRKVMVSIRNTIVEISCGDIFKTDGYRVIGCDTNFNTRIDDIVISKNSLQGQLFLNYGDIKEIEDAIKKEAKTRGLSENKNGHYDFPLGSIIRYKNSHDNQVYLLLAMTKLDEKFMSHTNMAEYELMLMRMWKEISQFYASNDVVLPLLGDGITRFEDGPKGESELLRCILCTLNASGVSLNSKVKVVIFNGTKKLPLYEYKNLFRIIPGGK